MATDSIMTSVATNFDAEISEAADGLLTSVLINSFLGDFLWFAAGFVVLRILCVLGLVPKRLDNILGFSTGTQSTGRKSEPSKSFALKDMRAEATSGTPENLLAAWDREKDRTAMPPDVLTAVTKALAAKAPDRFVAELAGHLQRHVALAKPQVVHSLMDTAAQAGCPDLAEELSEAALSKLCLAPEPRTREILLAAFAAAGRQDKVDKLLAAQLPPAPKGSTVEPEEQRLRLHAAIVRGHLRSARADVAARQLVEVQQLGLEVPPKLVTDVVTLAVGQGNGALERALAVLGDKVPLPAKAAELARGCGEAAQPPSTRARRPTQRGYAYYEAQLKQAARQQGDSRASELFQLMLKDGHSLSEGLCGTLLARAGEAHNLGFAEEVAAYLRSRSMMSLATYKTLMKVYASSGQFDRACDLYDQIVADGIEPDHVMHGCLVKFAVKCGRTSLANKLFEQTGGGDIQNYMWLIRSAGREGNVERALDLLRKVQASRPEAVDMAVYNCALDACVMCGDEAKRQEVLAEMRAAGMVNLVSYNTLIKGHCTKGDLAAARRVLGEMESAGVKPDSASFNCLLGAAVAAGNHLHGVWDIIEEMDRKAVALDHYTISIMMKAARKARNPRDGFWALSVLDRDGVNPCEDDILLNTVLDACIYRKDTERLSRVLDAFSAATMRPSVHTYGLLIKAFSLLQQTARCRGLWAEMVGQRGLTPNDITFSCMLDALISAGAIQEAVAMFQEWKEKVPPNTVIYATLIKGFASLGDADGAMEMYRQMQAAGAQMNTVAYTSLIDAQVRAGSMAQADELLQQMQKDGCPPNVITYSTLARGYCVQGDLRKALATFQEMLSKGLSADTVIFNTLLDGCVKHSAFDLADELLGEMESYAVSPTNVTLSIVVKMWGKRRCLDEAFQAVRSALRSQRYRVDAQVGTCLVSACLYNNNLNRALEAFGEIRKWPGCDGPDSAAYGNLISALVRHGRCQEAVELAEEAHKLASRPRGNFKPVSPEVLRTLFRAMHQEASSMPPLSDALRAAAAAAGAGEGAASGKVASGPRGARGGNWRTRC